jgi:hypothetical protein
VTAPENGVTQRGRSEERPRYASAAQAGHQQMHRPESHNHPSPPFWMRQ